MFACVHMFTLIGTLIFSFKKANSVSNVYEKCFFSLLGCGGRVVERRAFGCRDRVSKPPLPF